MEGDKVVLYIDDIAREQTGKFDLTKLMPQVDLCLYTRDNALVFPLISEILNQKKVFGVGLDGYAHLVNVHWDTCPQIARLALDAFEPSLGLGYHPDPLFRKEKNRRVFYPSEQTLSRYFSRSS